MSKKVKKVEKMTISDFVDGLVRLKTQGKKEIALTAYCLKHLAFCMQNYTAIETEIKRRMEEEEKHKKAVVSEVVSDIVINSLNSND